MSLQNLVGLSLDTVTPDKTQVTRLLAAATRNLADAQLAGLSAENRFDAAYKACMQLAMLALHANGLRTLTSRPGHHQTALQTLGLTVALPEPQIRVLDALRKQRNLADYSGDTVPESAVAACLSSGLSLQAHLRQWLRVTKPELM